MTRPKRIKQLIESVNILSTSGESSVFNSSQHDAIISALQQLHGLGVSTLEEFVKNNGNPFAGFDKAMAIAAIYFKETKE